MLRSGGRGGSPLAVVVLVVLSGTVAGVGVAAPSADAAGPAATGASAVDPSPDERLSFEDGTVGANPPAPWTVRADEGIHRVSSSYPGRGSLLVDGFEDGAVADDWADVEAAEVVTADTYAGDYSLAITDRNDEMNDDTGNRIVRSFPAAQPERLSAAVRIDDGSFNTANVNWYNESGQLGHKIRIRNYAGAVEYGGRTLASAEPFTWYYVELTGIDWERNVIGEIRVNGETAATDVPFAGPADRITGVALSTNDGGTGSRSFFDDVTVPTGDAGPRFEVTGLTAPSSTSTGSPVTYTAEVTNTGAENGTRTVTARFAGEPVDSRTVTLDAGTSTTLAFTASAPDAPGRYDAVVDTEDDAARAAVDVVGQEFVCGQSTGDPHITTFGGASYDFMAAGDYVLAREPAGDLLVVARQAPVSESVSLNNATATVVDGDRVVIDAEAATPVSVNGDPVEIASGESVQVGAGGEIRRQGRTYSVVYPGDDGEATASDERLTVDVIGDRVDIELCLHPDREEAVEGLFGDTDGDASDDIALADGTSLDRPLDPDRLYGQFRDDWRATGTENPFAADYFVADFPREIVTVEDLSAEERERAEDVLENTCLEPGTPQYRDALIDVALTGDESYVASACQVDRGDVEDVDTGPPADADLIVDGFEDGDLSEYDDVEAAETTTEAAYAGERSLRIVDQNDDIDTDQQGRIGNAISRSFPKSAPSRLTAALRIDDGSFNTVIVDWRNESGQPVHKLRIRNYAGAVEYGGRTLASAEPFTWYYVELTGIDWERNVIGEIRVNGETAATDVPFANPGDGVSTVTFRVHDGGTGSVGYFDEVSVGADDAPADVDLGDADARLARGGLFWYGQVLGVRVPGRAGETIQLRSLGDGGTSVAGEVAFDADGEALVRTGTLPESATGGFALATGPDTFLVIEDGRVVGTTGDPAEASFDVVRQAFDVEFTPADPPADGTTTLSILSNRGRYAVYVDAARAPDGRLVRFFGQADGFDPTDVDVDGDGDADDGDGIRVVGNSAGVERELPVDPLAAGEDTMTFEVTDAVASESVDLAVGSGGAEGVSLALRPNDTSVAVGGTATFEVVARGIDAGVGSYDLTVNSSDAATAALTGATAEIGGSGRAPLAEDGSGARLGGFNGDTADTGPVTIGTVTVEGVAPGSVELSLRSESIADEPGDLYPVAGTTDATLAVREGGPDVGDDGAPATDPDDDGFYEDVNGDGRATPADATVLFNAAFDGDPAVTENVALFDFNDDGRVTPADATVLFNEIFG